MIDGVTTFYWDDIKHASKYLIQVMNNNGHWVNFKVVTVNKVVIDRSFNDYHKFRIIACNYKTCINTGIASKSSAINRNVTFIHTDLLGSPISESN
ncbi:hypothetical protein CEX98_05020 [Pseudoalteromonas piscicida]|uniref:Uncharacterized protein n=1 Tax=Pseudoalteromonas piscicida TaxID=43662 RepID=A0A2A5JTM0_PSEO7|nr:hypothetical protein CEX98_05020 [Pseudoalteromonas piscicida]